MPRKIPQPEDEWLGASLEQVADLRAWVLLRMSERHADNVAAWLLSLESDDPPEYTARQLGFYRGILEEYGLPRPVVATSRPDAHPTDGRDPAAGDPDTASGSADPAPYDRLRRAP